MALDPVGGEVYGLSRLAADGLYQLTGVVSPTRLKTYSNPASLIFDADGNAFISEDYSGNIHRYDTAGVSTVWVSGFHDRDDDPWGMPIAPQGFNGLVSAGDVLVSDRGYSGPDEIWAFSSNATL